MASSAPSPRPWSRRLGWLLLSGGLLWLLSACRWVSPAPPTPLVWPSPTATITLTPTPTQVPFPPTATPTPLPPTPILTPTPDPLAEAGALLTDDAFADPRVWQAGRANGGQFAVAQGMLSLSVPQGPGYVAALRSEPDLHNLVLRAEFRPRLCRGGDAYGVLLRADAVGASGFRVGVTCDGLAFVEYLQGASVTLVGERVPVGLPTGPPVEVPLTVRLERNHLWLYVYQHLVLEAAYQGRYRGRTGAFVRAAATDPAAVDVLRWQVWPLKGNP